VHNEVVTREELQEYDPQLFQLIDESFKSPQWRYVRYDKRSHPIAATPDRQRDAASASQ
jgi:hypothetical protein